MTTKNIEFVVCHKEIKTIYTRCSYTEDDFGRFLDDDEESLAKWNAMPLEQRQAIIDKCVEDGCFPFSIGDSTDDEDTNRLQCWDIETKKVQEEDSNGLFDEDYISFSEYILKEAKEAWKTPEQKLADIEKQREYLRKRAEINDKIDQIKKQYQLQMTELNSLLLQFK